MNERRRIGVAIRAIAIVLLVASLVGGPLPARAATFTVTNLNDSGAGSLRQALADAAALAGPDTIDFDAGLSGSVVLTSGTLQVNSDVTIDGDERIILDGNLGAGVVKVATGVTATLVDLTITRGKALLGAGIYNDGTLTVAGSAVSGNTAHGSGISFQNFGIGVYNSGSGTLTLTGSTISNNAATNPADPDQRTFGAGVYNEGTLTMTDSVVSGNTASFRGGGVYNAGSMTLVASTLAANSAGFFGGGAENHGSLEVVDSTVSGNTAGSSGGGIYNARVGTLTLTRTLVSGNSAVSAGGGINIENQTISITTLVDSTFSNNSARYGGGIAVGYHAVATIAAGNVTDNTASANGGGIYANGGRLTLTDSFVTGNSAVDGGGAYLDYDSTLTATNSTITDNSASGDGGGVVTYISAVTFVDSVITHNAAGDDGGGIAIDDNFIDEFDHTVTLSHSAVSGNHAAGDGGGIYTNTHARLTLAESSISANSAGLSGGGVHNFGDLTLDGSTVSGNSAIDGGGVHNAFDGDGFGSLTLANSTLSGNLATTGGGLHNSTTATLTNGTIAANQASLTGGGVFTAGSTVETRGTIVAGNSAPASADCAGGLTSAGHNLGGDGSCGLNAATDQPNTDPQLGPLASNGGPTETHLPAAGSPAIDAIPIAECLDGDGNPLATDQRGTARPQGPACDIGSVEVGAPTTPVNTAPVANDDSYATDEDTTLAVATPGVLGNDTDADGDLLTASLVSGPSNGALTLHPDGSFSYTPNPDFHGADSFSYVTNDGELDSNLATVAITINAVNHPPVIDAGGDVTGDEGAAIALNSSVVDPDGPALSHSWTVSDPVLCAFADATSASTTITCADDAAVTVTLTADDGLNASVSDSVAVTVNNVAPSVNIAGDAELQQGETFSGSGSFSDLGADEWTGTVDYGDGSGSQPLALNADTPFALSHIYTTVGSFIVQVCVADDDDGEGCASLTATVTEPAATRYAIFAGRDDCGSGNVSAIHWSGSSSSVTGDVHSNSGLKISGSKNRVDGATTYRCDKHISGSQHTFTEGVTQISEVQPWPVQLTVDDFDCDISVSGKLDLSKDGVWWVGGTKHSEQLAPLTLCADEIMLGGSSISGEVTLVAGEITLSGSNLQLTANQHGVLALATGSGNDTIKVSGSDQQFSGDLVARAGQVDLSGSGGTVHGSLIGWTVKISGSGWTIDAR